jgi:hypothetical protein
MDLLTIQRKNAGFQNRWPYNGMAYATGESGSDEKADRINTIVKKVEAKGPIKNKWGGTDYPIDISDYGQFLSTLQTLSWVLRDLGYDITFLSKGGLHYQNADYIGYSNLFDLKESKILAIVAVGKQGKHYRISRDGSSLRIRRFDNVTRAIAPLGTTVDPGSKVMSPNLVKEIVRVMKTQSALDPKDPLALRRFGRIVQSKALKPVGAGVLKSQLAIQFKKV